MHLDRKSEALCSSKSSENLFDVNYDEDHKIPILTENTESIPLDLSS